MPVRRVHQERRTKRSKGLQQVPFQSVYSPALASLLCFQLEPVCRSFLSLTLVLWWYTCIQAFKR